MLTANQHRAKQVKAERSGPLVTVGVALYNHQSYIGQCLQSIVLQTYHPVQLIVIDDGSQDASYAVARRYLEQQSHQCDYILRSRDNRGICHTLNEIASLARGEYISFIGSDDYWTPGKIEDQVGFLEAHPECALVHSNSVKVDAYGNAIKLIDYSRKVNCGNVFEAIVRRAGGINTPSHLYRTSVYDDIGFYDPAFHFEDTDFWLRLAKRHQVGFIDKVHSYYRWHGKNLSDQANALRFYNDELIRIFRKNIEDRALRRYAIARVCRKSMCKSLQALRFKDAWRYGLQCLRPD